MINVSVKAYGPIFDGRAERAVAQAVDEAEQEIARDGANHLKGDLGMPPFKHPTGWYASHITEQRLGSVWIVQDSGVIYGHWLAGTGSRNATSRFKGYRHWQRLITYLHRSAPEITRRVVDRALARLA